MDVWELLATPGFAQMPVQQKAALYLDAKRRQEEETIAESRVKNLEQRVSAVESNLQGSSDGLG